MLRKHRYIYTGLLVFLIVSFHGYSQFQSQLRSQFFNSQPYNLSSLNETLLAVRPNAGVAIEKYIFRYYDTQSQVYFYDTTQNQWGYSSDFTKARDVNGNSINSSDTEFHVDIKVKISGSWGANYGTHCRVKTPVFPVITTNGTLNGYDYCKLAPSAEQNFTLSGEDLIGNISISATSGFEISETSGGVFSNSITLAHNSGVVATTTIYVKAITSSSGSFNGMINCSSTGALTMQIEASSTINPHYTINYLGNNSTSGNVSSTNGCLDLTVASNANGFERTGYIFDSWNTNASGNNGTTYNPGDLYGNAANLDLYAQWTQNNITITFNANDGSSSTGTSTQTILSGISTSLDPNTFTKSGFTFNNWNTNITGTGTSYNDQEAITITTDITLYAQWTATTLNISQDLIGSQGDFIDDGQNGSISYSVGEPIIFTINNQITQGFQQPNDINNSSMVLNEISSKPILKSPLNNQNSTNLLSSHDLNVKIYPNPSNGEKIMIEAIGFDYSIGKYKIKIFDVSSKLIDEFTHESNDYLFMEINFSKQLVNGFYFINIRKGEDQIIKKFIVK